MAATQVPLCPAAVATGGSTDGGSAAGGSVYSCGVLSPCQHSPPSTPARLLPSSPAQHAAISKPGREAAARPAPAPAVTCISHLPLELLSVIMHAVLADDAEQQRRPVAQFVGQAWLAAYRCVAYSSVRLDVAAAMGQMRQRGLQEPQAAAALLAGLAVQLPHAVEVDISGLPPAASLAGTASWQLRRHIGQLLLAALSGSTHLRRLSVDYLPQLPLLLQRRQQQGPRVLPLDSLGVTALPAADLLQQLALLQQQPLRVLAVADAACLPNRQGALLADALCTLRQLSSLSLGGDNIWDHNSSGSSGSDACSPGSSGSSSSSHEIAAALAAASAPPLPPPPAVIRLPNLKLVAAAAALPSLQQLELSLTFGKQQSAAQQEYLQQLGCVLHQQRRLREQQHLAATAAAAAGIDGECNSSCCDGGGEGSRVSVVIHEHVQGDLSAVPVASCSLNLDWDDESNPIEVWQCSTLRQLRISAQLPLQAGHFRPTRLAALQVLQVAGCCHIPLYFAQALVSMQQLSRLEFSECMLQALAAVPWPEVLPRLPALREVCVESCTGAVLLPGLWAGLAGCSQLRRLRLTGQNMGRGRASRGSGSGSGSVGVNGAAAAAVAAAAASMACAAAQGPQPHKAQEQQQPQQPQQWQPRDQQQQRSGIPDCIALLQQLRQLDLSHNGLHAVPDMLSWCQQLTAVNLKGNRLHCPPPGVAALANLRKLDLSSNQLSFLCGGAYLHQLEELLLGDNLLLPTQLPLPLLQAHRLRRLGLPAWWQLAGSDELGRVLLALVPWLALEHC